MRATFRTDASIEIGTGHVMRCLTLADALRDRGVACSFITRILPGHMADRIDERGFAVLLLPAPSGAVPAGPPAHAAWAGVDWEQDAEQTRAVLEGDDTDWLVLDHYAFDARWEEQVRAGATKLMVIDDLADRPHLADLLLDQTFGRGDKDYAGLIPGAATCLLGPRYALLRPEFTERHATALADRAGRKPRHILISMGGVDVADATSRILTAMKTASLPSDTRITVVMGRSAPALQRVRDLAATLPWQTEVVIDVSDMPHLMADADLAVGAAGMTTWERCCLGLPTIIMETAANQSAIARNVIAAGAALDPGPLHAAEFAETLRTSLEMAMSPACLAGLSGKAAAICDGLGTQRVVGAMGLGAAS
jgi:UDP-2,4-diacetamido-2,4,6-trideoxy-beta-L-altropyranose hydrolase